MSNDKPIITLESLKQRKKLPPRICFHGDGGVGKTTQASLANKPIIIPTEDGLGDLETPAWPLCTSLDNVRSAISWLAKEDHEFKTAIVDSLDWLETLIWKKVLTDYNATNNKEYLSVTEIPYGEGYNIAMKHWDDFLAGLNYLRSERGMMIILIAHSAVTPVSDPMQPTYDRHSIKLHKKAAAKIIEYCDIVAYCAYKMVVKTEKENFNKRGRAISSGERVMYLEGSPSYVAKNRYSLPTTLPFSMIELTKELT